MALVKKGPFLWLFMAIKFELSLVITFMAFYDCVRTLVCILYAYIINPKFKLDVCVWNYGLSFNII